STKRLDAFNSNQATLDGNTEFLDFFSDLSSGNCTEKTASCTNFFDKFDRFAFDLFLLLFSSVFFSSYFLSKSFLLVLEDVSILLVSKNGELTREEEVTGVTGRNVNDLADHSKGLNLFSKDDFHIVLLKINLQSFVLQNTFGTQTSCRRDRRQRSDS